MVFATGPTRRAVLTGLAGLAAGSALSACGSGAKTPGGTTTLNVWGGVPPENGPNEVIAAFEKKFPKTRVTYHRYVNDPQGNVKLDTALQGGAPIDVYFSYNLGLITQRVTSHLALDLTDRIKADGTFATLSDPNQPKSLWFDNRQFSLVTARDPWAVFVNMKLAEGAGLTIPDTWTTDEFRSAAASLAGKGKYGMLAFPETARIELGPDYWYKKGGTESNFDHPAFRRQAENYLGALKAKSALPYADFVSQKLDVYQQNPFLRGDIGLWSASPFNCRYINDTKEYPRDFKVAMAPLPRTSEGAYWNTGLLSNDIMISAKSRNPDAAWDFVTFYLTQGAVPMIKSGRLPILMDKLDEDVILRELLGPQREKLYDVESVRKVLFAEEPPFPVDTLTAGSTEIKSAYDETRKQMYLGELTVDAWAETLKKRADDAIAKAS